MQTCIPMLFLNPNAFIYSAKTLSTPGVYMGHFKIVCSRYNNQIPIDEFGLFWFGFMAYQPLLVI